MFVRLLFPVFVLALLTGTCLGQSQDTSSGPSTSAESAAPPTTAQPGTSPEKKKTKKVWTNDEIGAIKGDISVVGDADSSSEKSGDMKPAASTDANKARQKQIGNFRNRIRQLQAQIDSADKRIDQLKNFKGENTSPSGGINPNQGYDMVPVEDQVKQLEEKKKQLEAKIEDVESEARKNGIEPGDLR